MKKMMLLLLTLALVLLCSTAMADTVYSLVAKSQSGEDVVGSAVLVASADGNCLFLGGGYVPEEGVTLSLRGSEGEIEVQNAFRAVGGVLWLETETPEWGIADLRLEFQPEDAVRCIGVDRSGQQVSMAVSQVTPVRLGGYPMYTLTAGEGMLPGAALVDKRDGVLAVLCAQLSEGSGRWLAVTPQQALALEDSVFSRIKLQTPVEGFATQLSHSYADGLLQLSWTDAVPEGKEGRWRVYYEDTANSFYTWQDDIGGSQSITMAVVPGRSYEIWVQWYNGSDQPHVPSAALYSVSVPAAEPVSRYDYTETSAWVTASDDEWGETDKIPENPVSINALNRGVKMYLQVVSHYTVSEEVEELLTFELVTPGGESFTMLAGFIYMADTEEDVWHADLTELMMSALQWAEDKAGEWTLNYYYDGDLANTVHFTLWE